nr:MAG TPA_asm: hypothetical protein [Caudoviricetes sp.]
MRGARRALLALINCHSQLVVPWRKPLQCQRK